MLHNEEEILTAFKIYIYIYTEKLKYDSLLHPIKNAPSIFVANIKINNIKLCTLKVNQIYRNISIE